MKRTFARVLSAAAVIAVHSFVAITTRAQEEAETVVRTDPEAVYSVLQASRGARVYGAECSRCHGVDLGGGAYAGDNVPALRRDNLLRSGTVGNWFDRLRRTMPIDRRGVLSDQAYVDVLAFLLQENGFAPGADELPPDLDALLRIQIVTEGRAPNFSLVQVIGCLSSPEAGTWELSSGSDPRVVAAADVGPEALAAAQREPLGTQRIDLLNTPPDAAGWTGHTVVVRGILIRLDAGLRVNVSEMASVAASCGR